MVQKVQKSVQVPQFDDDAVVGVPVVKQRLGLYDSASPEHAWRFVRCRVPTRRCL